MHAGYCAPTALEKLQLAVNIFNFVAKFQNTFSNLATLCKI